jgi:transcriptional regulator with XRE-family HTH domain
MLGSVLREVREEAGLTQEALADAANLHRTYVSLVERDLRSPTVAVLFRLCRALRIKPSEFVARLEMRHAYGVSRKQPRSRAR